MNDRISPKYQMKLINDVENAIWETFKSYKNVLFYMKKWHESEYSGYNVLENFSIIEKHDGEIDLTATLHNVDGETLLKIAIDLGVYTPDFIPSIAIFKNEIKSDYMTAYDTFQKALRQIESQPDLAIGLANSALESIIKEILKDSRISTIPMQEKTLYDLVSELLKEFQLFPKSNIPIEIRTLGSSLLAASQSIEKIRSKKTIVHGKTDGDYIIDDSIYTYFIVNSVTTVGLFLNSYYKSKFPKPKYQEIDDNEIPF